MFEFININGKEIVIEGIIQAEWKMFQKVNNINGRAGCQDEWETFRIMRYSQFNSWPDELISSYSKDLEAAARAGRNLITEKYGYMMEFNSPDYFKDKLEPFLPKVDGETMALIEEIVRYMVACEKEIPQKYPKISNAGRAIESGVNIGGVTSVETYAIGELKTYSRSTLNLYLDFVRKSKSEGSNMVLKVKDTMVKMYGYTSLEHAESKM